MDGSLKTRYDCLVTLESRTIKDRFRRRFLHLFLADLAFLYNPTHIRVSREWRELLIEETCPTGDSQGAEDVIQKVQKWLSFGRRYRALAGKFGAGVLFELSISEKK